MDLPLSDLRQRLARYLRRLADRLSPRARAAAPDGPLLEALVEHIAYEMAAMEAAAGLWQETHVWIALEDFLLHARLLREFFWETWDPADRYAASAVRAEHYHPAWRHSSGGPPAVFRGGAKEAMDKQLAHIARERVTAPQELEPLVDLMKAALWDAWRRFLTQMGTDARAGQFREKLKLRCALLAITAPPGAV